MKSIIMLMVALDHAPTLTLMLTHMLTLIVTTITTIHMTKKSMMNMPLFPMNAMRSLWLAMMNIMNTIFAITRAL